MLSAQQVLVFSCTALLIGLFYFWHCQHIRFTAKIILTSQLKYFNRQLRRKSAERVKTAHVFSGHLIESLKYGPTGYGHNMLVRHEA
jgi:hypothetical protein